MWFLDLRFWPDDAIEDDQWDSTKSRRTSSAITGLILGLHPANERRRYFVTTSLIGWAQT